VSVLARPTLRLRTASDRQRHILLLCALGVLFVAIMLASRHQRSDEGSYVHLAYDMVGRHYAASTAPSLWFGPGLSLLLAPLVLVHAPLEVLRLLGPLLLTASLVLFYELLRLYVAPRQAFLTALGLGVYLPLFVLLPSLHSELPALLAVVVFMYAVTRDVRRPSRRSFSIAAAALAYLALSRVVFGWILLALVASWVAMWLARRSAAARRMAAINALALVLCLPWLAYTYSVSHKVFYWGSSGGDSLYWMASPYTGQLGDWHANDEVFSNPVLAPNRPDFARTRTLDQVQGDDVLRHQATRWIRAHPTQYVRHVADNLSRIWFNFPYSFTAEHLGLLLYVVPDALLLACAAFSMFVLWRSRRDVPLSVQAFVLFFVLGLGVQSLLAAYQRMLIPLVPPLLLITAYCVQQVRNPGPPEEGFDGPVARAAS
jgi:hypothetical protein